MQPAGSLLPFRAGHHSALGTFTVVKTVKSTEHIQRRANPRNTIKPLVAQGRLKMAKKLFAANGWKTLPKTTRGRRVLEWGADHAWCSRPSNRAQAVREWYGIMAPGASEAQIEAMLKALKKGVRNLKWTADQSAMVLELSLDRCRELKLQKFLGADDDINYDRRRGIAGKGGAARSRKYRAKKSTGRPRGRPKKQGPKEWQLAGYNSERTYHRHKALGILAPKNGSKNASRINKNLKRDGISLPKSTAVDRRAPKRDGAPDRWWLEDDHHNGGLMPPLGQAPNPPPA